MLRFYPHRKAKKMRLEPYREAWHLLQEEEEDEAGPPGKIDLQAQADDTIYPDNQTNSDIASSIVIPSEGADRRSRSAPQSRDLASALSPHPTHLPASAAPWPIPPLKILATRKGKQILPTPQNKKM